MHEIIWHSFSDFWSLDGCCSFSMQTTGLYVHTRNLVIKRNRCASLVYINEWEIEPPEKKIKPKQEDLGILTAGPLKMSNNPKHFKTSSELCENVRPWPTQWENSGPRFSESLVNHLHFRVLVRRRINVTFFFCPSRRCSLHGGQGCDCDWCGKSGWNQPDQLWWLIKWLVVIMEAL